MLSILPFSEFRYASVSRRGSKLTMCAVQPLSLLLTCVTKNYGWGSNNESFHRRKFSVVPKK